MVRVTVEVQPDGSLHREGARSEIGGSLQIDRATGQVRGGSGTRAFSYSPMAASVVYECIDSFTITPG